MPPIDWPTLSAGAALCVGGWILYWVGLHLTGALAGACLGLTLAWVGSQVIAEGDPTQMWWALPVGGVAGFVLGIFLIRGLHRFFFFFVGATLGMAMGQALYEWTATQSAWVVANPALARALFIVGGSILAGLAMLYGSKWVVALTTSALGSIMVVVSIPDPLALLAAPPLAIASFLLQIGVLRQVMPAPRRKREPKDD
ncbi:hypothetical protein JW916_09860 [Candidatus Sumerlaeota bacterium]|nr:hypothetical protein [Candidatus Sumerlaeota bacterium]